MQIISYSFIILKHIQIDLQFLKAIDAESPIVFFVCCCCCCTIGTANYAKLIIMKKYIWHIDQHPVV